MHTEWGDGRVLILDRDATLRLFSLDIAIEAVEEAYRAHASGVASLFPVVRERLENGAVCGIKSGYWPAASAVGLKVAGSWPANRARGLETHQATVVLCDAETGRLRALIDGNAVTTQRTAAAGAVGLRALARPDARIAAILGAGTQGMAQALAVRHVYPALHEMRVWARDPARADVFAARLRAAGIDAVVAPDAASALRGSNLVVTATPSGEALFSADAVAPGTHINAMGADTRGKRELPPDLLRSATLVVDDRDQACALGESQSPVVWEQPPATIGEVLTRVRPGRTDDAEITVFDSTGIGLQDVMAAACIYEQALRTGAGFWLNWGARSAL